MKIPYNGYVYNLIYTENNNGDLNTILYSFDRFSNAFEFMKEMVGYTRKNLDEIRSSETQKVTHQIYWEDKKAPYHEFASIEVDEELTYTFELRRIPVFTSAKYDFFGDKEEVELTDSGEKYV